ncbi:MAG: membrane dipeptidase [Anaerolineae bacterium]|nr:membrane dipeptidase [Anaerolineae bacterium]
MSAQSQPPDPTIIVDAHQDIAWNTVTFGRDFTQSALRKRQDEAASGSDAPARAGTVLSGLPEALLGRVGLIFATLYVSPATAPFAGSKSYETPAQAEALAQDQIDVYNRLADENERITLVRTQAELHAVLDTWRDGVDFEQHRVGLVMLMEGADPIITPRHTPEWAERGVRIIGPAWTATRYSGGTHMPGPLTALGRELLDVMADEGLILDLSHMAEEAFLEAVDRYEGVLIASHSNPRRFCNTDRHLSDDMIRRLAERDGVMGIVPYTTFLWDRGAAPSRKSDTPLARVVDAIDHVCQVTGSTRHVGIGTDFDGGFGVERTPTEIDTLADLALLTPLLRARGFEESDITAILGGNFLRILRAALPA